MRTGAASDGSRGPAPGSAPRRGPGAAGDAGAGSRPRIWNPAETMPRDELKALQLNRLRTSLARILRHQPVVAERLAAAGITRSGDITSLDDLGRLPFTSKADLRASYPFGLLAVPREQVVRLHASSGTHGKPTVVGYTRADLDTWTDLMARCMTMAGVRPGMVIHNANGYGLFTGGLGFHQGGERIGATVVPVSGGFTARQAMLLRDLGAQVLVSTPSYALAIAQALSAGDSRTGDGSTGDSNTGDGNTGDSNTGDSNTGDSSISSAGDGSGGDDSAGTAGGRLPDGGNGLRLELGLFGGEPWTEGMRAEIERALGLTAINFYGLSEMCGPGVAAECLTTRTGLHVQEDHFLVEVIDPADGTAVAPGAEGELVFTTLTKEALPLLRYRTGDIGRVTTEPCACGRTTARLTGLGGRRDDMLIIRGVNVFPSQVEHVLLTAGGVTPHYRLIAERDGPLDELTVECEPAGPGADHEPLRARLEHELLQRMGVRIRVTVAPPGTIPRSEGKAVRVLDRR